MSKIVRYLLLTEHLPCLVLSARPALSVLHGVASFNPIVHLRAEYYYISPICRKGYQ